MRTRFLNVDYFNSASIQALDTLEFLRFPLPHLPPSNLSNFEDIRCFDYVSNVNVSLEIDRLPIDDALSKFFSDVLPQTINVEIGDLANTQSCSSDCCFDEQSNFGSQKSVEIRISEKENDTSFDGKGKNSFEVAQFETPELDLFVENACFSEKEDMQNFLEVLEVENIQKGDPHSITTLSENNQKLEELLNFVPVEQKYNMGSLDAAYEVEACSMPLQVPCAPFSVESENVPTSMHSFPDTVIIVNTQNFEKEMIISRRSTYQKILAMEKEGAQVVERDLNLPVDVIISAAVCLAWYDCRNIGKKATAPDEASSCLSLCVENIAVNVLMSLSFSFSGCILIFEGESSFLDAILESSDELYAAAVYLGIDLQLFCSYSSELTDEIILSCIKNITKLTRGVYPKMPELETLAESFLTAFPSINPLSAHAILSSGGMLYEFLEWSHEHRIRAIQKYHFPDESATLFSALCRYVGREDSKSGRTDSSSTLSSAHDSENYSCQSDSERKKRKCIGRPQKIDIPLLHFESLKQFTNGSLNPTEVSKPYESWMSKSPGIFDEIEKPGVPLNDKLFGQKQGLAVAMMMNPSRVCKPYDSQTSGGLEISDEIRNPRNPSSALNDKLFGQKDGWDMAPMNRLDWGHNNNSENLQDDFIGEVIDINDSSSLGGDFSSIANTIGFSPLMPEMEKHPAAGNFRTATKFHRLSFQEKDKSQYGGTPLSNAIRSAQPQQGSPWTIEFLNRIREKSRLRQQSLPCDTSPHCSGYRAPTKKRLRSTTLLEFYKYKGGSSPRKKTSAAPTWTPIDKRARWL